MVGLLRPRTVYLKSNECALFSVSLRCDFSVSSSPYCTLIKFIDHNADRSGLPLLVKKRLNSRDANLVCVCEARFVGSNPVRSIFFPFFFLECNGGDTFFWVRILVWSIFFPSSFFFSS